MSFRGPGLAWEEDRRDKGSTVAYLRALGSVVGYFQGSGCLTLRPPGTPPVNAVYDVVPA